MESQLKTVETKTSQILSDKESQKSSFSIITVLSNVLNNAHVVIFQSLCESYSFWCCLCIFVFTEQLNHAARHRNVYYDMVGGDPYGKKESRGWFPCEKVGDIRRTVWLEPNKWVQYGQGSNPWYASLSEKKRAIPNFFIIKEVLPPGKSIVHNTLS